MLPLWIIDITKKSDRRDAFMHLVGQIDPVFISETCVTSEKKSGEYHNIKGEDQIDDSSKVIDARFKDDEKREAARNARVEGNYWYYSCYELENYFTKE